MDCTEIFMNQMEENCKFNLVYPFHIKSDALRGNLDFNLSLGVFHRHDFPSLLKVAYLEPYAFYLTEDDKPFYSNQELIFVEKVLECEKAKMALGSELMTFELTDETLCFLEQYREKNGYTMEEAINCILKEIIKEHSKNATP